MARGILCADRVIGDIELFLSTRGVSKHAFRAIGVRVAGVLVVMFLAVADGVQAYLLRCGVGLVTQGRPCSLTRRLLTDTGVGVLNLGEERWGATVVFFVCSRIALVRRKLPVEVPRLRIKSGGDAGFRALANEPGLGLAVGRFVGTTRDAADVDRVLRGGVRFAGLLSDPGEGRFCPPVDLVSGDTNVSHDWLRVTVCKGSRFSLQGAWEA